MLDDLLLRPILTFLLKLFFRVDVRGMEHYHAAGNRLVILPNHQSYLDPLLLAVLIPEKPVFAMNTQQAEKWYFRFLGKLVKIHKLDPLHPMSMKNLIRDVQNGAKVVIFPEGRITTTGGIMKIYDGASLIIEKSGATILPVRFDGAEYSKLSFMGKKLRQRWFPKIRMTLLPPQTPQSFGEPTTQKIYDLLTYAAFTAADSRISLLAAMVEAQAWHGSGMVIASDISRQDMSYRQLFTRANVLSAKLRAPLGDNRHVGVLLPNSLGVMVTFVALHVLGKIPCMLNFSAGAANIVHACKIATVKTVLTSRVFIEKAELQSVIAELQHHVAVLYLEDIRPGITLADKLQALWAALFPRKTYAEAMKAALPDDPAVVLYTSGSEGVPKGVVLSHANLLSNIYQVCARVDLNPSDHIFNAMPVFHSFGLLVGLVFPLVRGVRTFLYPSPLHYRIIPELVYDTNATVILGTDTFFKGYAHYAHDYDFYHVRLAVAGAEKLKESTRRMWAERFHVNILEGYGVTETSPVLSVNTPLEHKTGTVGRALPGIECRIQPVEGLDRGGRLEVKGSNVMLGYLKADQPGIIQPHGEWYDTGDIVEIDNDGYIIIQGRAKRFAKIAGEMVSLQAVEDMASAILPDAVHAAMAIPDDRKGEQVILYTESRELTRDQLIAQAKLSHVSELCVPRQVVYLEAIPRLGNGKIDYMALKQNA